MADRVSRLSEIIAKHEVPLIADWLKEQSRELADRSDLIKDAELKVQGKEFLELLRSGLKSGNLSDIQSPDWEGVRDILTRISRSRALQGFTPSETASFVFALKRPLFVCLQQELQSEPLELTYVA